MGFFEREPEGGSSTGTKIYQTRNFKLVAALAVALVLLFVGITTASLFVFNTPANQSQVPSFGHVEPLDNNSSSLSGMPVNGASNDLSLETLPASTVPALIKGSPIEGAYRVLRRNWKIALLVTIFIFIILAAIGAGLGLYFAKKRAADELAERERLDALEKAKEENEKGMLIGGHSLTKIMTIFAILYAFSLITTIFVVARTAGLPIPAKVVYTVLLFFLLQSLVLLLFIVFHSIRNGLANLRQALLTGLCKSFVSVAMFVVHYLTRFFEFLCLPTIFVTDLFIKDEDSRFDWKEFAASKWDDPPSLS